MQYNSIGRLFLFVAEIGTNERNHELPTLFIFICCVPFWCFFLLLLSSLNRTCIWIWIYLCVWYVYLRFSTSNLFNSLFCCIVSTLYTYTALISYFDDKYTYIISLNEKSQCLWINFDVLCLWSMFIIHFFFRFFYVFFTFQFFVRFCSCGDHFTWYTFESTLLRHLVSGLVSLLSPEPWATWLFDDFLFILVVCFVVCCASLFCFF